MNENSKILLISKPIDKYGSYLKLDAAYQLLQRYTPRPQDDKYIYRLI